MGGTGVISSACTALAAERGHDLTLLTRGESSRPVPGQVKQLQADIRQPDQVQQVLGETTYDVVVNWVAYTPEHIEIDLALFRGRTDHYVFISSASVYQTPPNHLPITESTPLFNPYWAYSRNKIACEERLTRAYREKGFPVTIVRPSHTYDRTLLPFHGQYTVVHRMRQGKPVIVPGDGTSLWTLTHHADFAVGFIGLLGNPRALGDVFQITSDEWLSWNQIYQTVGRAAGVEPDLVQIPSRLIAAFDEDWGSALLGDQAHSVIFDNSKIKRLVPEYKARIPFHRGAREIMTWYDADPARQTVDTGIDQTMDRILDAYRSAWPGKTRAAGNRP